MMKNNTFLYVILLIAFNISFAFGNSDYTVSSFKSLSKDVYIDARKIFHDSYGLTWIVSQRGVSLYDGSKIRDISMDIEQNILLGNYLVDIDEDSNKDIWITGLKGLLYYSRKEDHFTFIRYSDFLTDLDNIVNISFRCLEDKYVLLKGECVYCLIFNHEKRVLTIDKTLDIGSFVHECFVDSLGRYWFCAIKGLYLLDENMRLTRYLSDNVKMIKEYKGTFYILADRCVFKTAINDISQFETIHIPENIPYIRRILVDTEGVLWLGTYGGVYSYISEENFHLVQGTEASDVYSLSQDKSGTIWVCMINNDLLLINKRNITSKFYQYSENKGKGSRVKCILEDSHKNIWIGTQGNGLKCLSFDKDVSLEKLVNVPILHLNTKLENSAFKILEDTIGHCVYVGTGYPTWLQKITHYESGDQRQFHIKSFPAITSSVMSLCVDQKYLWVGTFKKGLIRIDRKDKIERVGGDIFGHNYVSFIEQDRKGNIFFSIGNRLYLIRTELKNNKHLDEVSIVEITDVATRPKKDISGICIDHESTIWIGTLGDGLYKISKEKDNYSVQHFTKKDKLFSDYIFSMVLDDNDRLWMTSSWGVMGVKDGKFNGIKDYEICSNGATRFSYKLSTGDLLFGGENGVNLFKSVSFDNNEKVPTPLITGISLFNKPVEVAKVYDRNQILSQNILETKAIQLKHNQNNITIYMASNYSAGMNNNQFKYLLEGFDQEWQVTSNVDVTYTNIPPGKYTFKLLTCNNSGIWGKSSRSLDITVIPPIWARWYAYLFYVFIFILLLILFRLYIVRKQRLHTKMLLLQAEEEQIKKISEMRQQFFANVSHELRTPLTLIIAPLSRILKTENLSEDLSKTLNLILKSAYSLLKQNNLFLNILRKDQVYDPNLKYSNLIKAIEDYVLRFNEWAVEEKIDIKIDTSFKSLDIWFDEGFLEQILFNLLSNAIKNTPRNGKIIVSIRRVDNEYWVSVADNGMGIPDKMQSKIFERNVLGGHKSLHSKDIGVGIGLSLTKKLVELQSWTIDFRSVVNEGTVFTIYIPAECGNESFDLSNEEVLSLDDDSSDSVVEAPERKSKKSPKIDTVEHATILIVEDHEEMRAFLLDLFSSHYGVVGAKDGKEAFDLLKENNIDLIISDIYMPRMTGIELCHQVKCNMETSHIPVILLTAQPSSDNQVESFEEMADAYLQKPFEVDVLESLAFSVLDNRRKIYEKFHGQIVVQPSELAPNKSDEIFLCQIVEYIEKNIDNPHIMVADVADSLGLSQLKLNAKLVNLTGYKANAFIRSLRLKCAAQLLAEGSLNVTEAMYSVGFSDIKYFRKCFKEEFGILPSEYQKQNQHSSE